MTFLFALLLQATAPAAVPPADVVVTARPIGELRAEWDACLTGRCPPEQEIARALALAEAKVAAGDYRGGWATLRQAKRRNMRYADSLPIPVARVARAAARLAGLNGQPVMSRVGMIDSVDALKKGLDNQDARILIARIDVGDAYVDERRIDAALDLYRRVEKMARAAGLPAIAALTRYRTAMLKTALATSPYSRGDMPYYGAAARRELAQIAASDDPAMAEYRDAARLVALNFLPERKRVAAVDAMLGSLTPRRADSPILAYAPSIDLSRTVVDAPPAGEAQQWADIAFRIAPTGRVSEAAPISHSRHMPDGWLDAAVTALRERRYIPLQLPPADPGVRRAARVTFVSDTGFSSGSRIAQASASPRIDIVDLGTLLTTN